MRTPVMVLNAVFVLSPALADDTQTVEYGKYVCISDRAAGIQPDDQDPSKRFAGQIQLLPERQKFFIEIAKIQQTDDKYSTKDSNGIPLHNEYLCSLLAGKLKWENGFEFDFSNFVSTCLSKSVININDGQYVTTLHSFGKNMYYDFNSSNSFWIVNRWNFQWIYGAGGGFTLVSEGRCDLISKTEPPK